MCSKRWLLCALAAVFVVVSCAPAVNNISTRNPGLFDKPEDYKPEKAHEPGKRIGDQIFVRDREVQIVPADVPNETGSLFSADDERNYLFASRGPVAVGRYLPIYISSNRREQAPEAAAETADAGGDSNDALEQELLASLPDLTPAEEGEANLIKRLKMKVAHRYANGDALVTYRRTSLREEEAKDVSVQARVPYDRLVAGDRITTDDLQEVRFVQSSDGELVERESSGWEDEYSLRISGFDEAQSLAARQIDDQRKQLNAARDSLENRMKSFAAQRREVSAERTRLAEAAEKQDEEVQKLKDEIETKDQKIQAQEQEIADLQPEDKPGDERDGSDGDE